MNRRGLTLVEIILVLSLLVIIGAVAAPLLEGSFARSRLHHGGDLLRAAWSRARLAAIETGAPHVFRYQVQGSGYQILPLVALSDPAAAYPPATGGDERDPSDMLRLGGDRLPDGVVFAFGQVSSAPQLAAVPMPADGAWSSPIVFRPDGTTSDAVVLLANARGQRIRVTLRGLTGISRASDVLSEDEL
jgi:prepilin-type N-terminal cleavage/methylation domain-containing protein